MTRTFFPRFAGPFCTVLLLACFAEARAAGEAVPLWPEGAPGAVGTAETDIPQLTVHVPDKENQNGAAVVVNPGGGYRILAADYEGLQVARWLNSIGVTAFVLRYRLMPEYQPTTALLDAQRAIRHVRHNAEEYGISKSRIGMLGFSAGGHLTTAAGTVFDAGDPEAKDPVDRESSRPDFLVPVYAAVSTSLLKAQMGDWMSTDVLVTDKTPPAFLVHTHEDTLVTPNHSIVFYQALLKAGVPAELHIFTHGAHGLGLGAGDPDFNQWQPLLANWLRRNGYFTNAKRVAIAGTVKIDGEPVFGGWLTLVPEDERLPIAVANLGMNKKGVFKLDANTGPCPGKYRVEVRRTGLNFEQSKTGAYTVDDVELYTLPGTIEITPETKELSVDVSGK